MAAYTVYWRHEYWKSLPAEDSGPRLVVLFGGVHQSQPSFLGAGVKPGDRVFPITARLASRSRAREHGRCRDRRS